MSDSANKSWFRATRRHMLGHLCLGAGAGLGSCGFPVAASDVGQRGKVLLDRMPKLPKGLQ